MAFDYNLMSQNDLQYNIINNTNNNTHNIPITYIILYTYIILW